MLPSSDLLRMAADGCATLAVLGCIYLVAACLLVRRYASRRPHVASEAPPVTLLVPLCGREPGLESRLSALRRQRYPGPVQIVCGVLDPADPAVAAAKAVAAQPLGHEISVYIDPRVSGRNLKISNLINMIAYARHDVLVMIDSDIVVDGDYLRSVVGELQQDGVGAATCLYGGVSVRGLWGRLGAMKVNLYFLPGAVVGLSLRLAHPCCGATIAMSRDTLRRIGGLQPFVDQVCDDYAIGEAVRDLGKQVAISRLALGHVQSEIDFAGFLTRQLRFARTIKSIDWVGYTGGIVTHPFALALIAALCGGGSHAWAIAAFALACRAVLARIVTKSFRVERPSYLLLPVLECLAFAIYAASFLSTNVVWRGQRYRISTSRVLLPRAD